MKSKMFHLLLLLLLISSCSTDDNLQKSSSGNTSSGNTNQNSSIQGKKNQFDIKSISNLVLLNQAVSLPTGKNSNTKTSENFFFTDNLGNITTLQIPNAKSFTLKVNSLMECTKDLILVTGLLNIVYLDDTTENLYHFVLDKTDGSFYKISETSYSEFNTFFLKKATSTPWVNGELQYDDNNAVYLKGNNSSGIIQEIYKAEFVKSSPDTIDVTFTTINLISQSYYFNFYVLPNGDIVYMYVEDVLDMVWRVRFKNGQTLTLENLTQGSPFLVNGVKYFDSISTRKCFGVKSSNNQFIFFIQGKELPSSQSSVIKPFKLTTNSGQVTFESLETTIPAYFISNLGYEYPLFSDYYHGMWYFKNNNLHVFTNRLGPANIKENIWWSYDDKTNVVKNSFASYSTAEFTTNQLLTGSSSNYACVPIGQAVHFVNLENLEINTVKNLGFQIFKTQYRNDNVLQFYGISFSTGKKVYGEIKQTGEVKIINEFESTTVEVKDIIKIGNF